MMDNYKVTHTTSDGDGVTHVSATSRENATYAALDELMDKGFTVHMIGDVHMFDSLSSQWVLIPSHRQLSTLTK
jgi:hypothetical protein